MPSIKARTACAVSFLESIPIFGSCSFFTCIKPTAAPLIIAIKNRGLRVRCKTRMWPSSTAGQSHYYGRLASRRIVVLPQECQSVKSRTEHASNTKRPAKWSRTYDTFIMTMTKNPQSLRSAVAASTAMLLPLVLCLAASAFAAQTSPATDSYLNAYSELQATKPTRSKSNDREYSVHQGIDFAAAGYPEGPVYRPEGPYPPSAPQPEYGAPQAVYGPPKPAYGPPHFEYGPPKPVYGPPTAPAYGPPKPIYGPPSHR